MLIDVHTHLLPEQISKNPQAFAEVDDYFGFLTTPSPFNTTVQCFASYQEAVRQMDLDGVDMAVIQGWPLIPHEYCVMQNDYTLEAMKAYPGRFLGFGAVNPTEGINALREVQRCAGAGMAGIGELDPCGQGFSLRDENFLKICDLCVDLDLVMCIHISEPVGNFYPGKSSVSLADYVNLIQAKPLLKVILPHWGGGLPFYELMPEISAAFTNVYYDTACSPLLCSPAVYNATINLLGSEKVMFGTDYPLLLYPNRENRPGFAGMIKEIQDQIGEEKSLKNILGQNAMGLFHRHLSLKGA
ncbi:MAG: amidohydrolase family protein [Bacillota bacterium]